MLYTSIGKNIFHHLRLQAHSNIQIIKNPWQVFEYPLPSFACLPAVFKYFITPPQTINYLPPRLLANLNAINIPIKERR
jgi:hypothetical protein